MKIDRDKLKLACNQMKIASLDEDDCCFLEEYYEIITPIACALKSLEANRFAFGLYLPILTGIRKKLNDLKKKRFVYGKPLINALEKGFEQRFAEFLDIYDLYGRSVPLYIAMVTNPQYKLNFLGFERIPSHISNKVQTMLLNAGKEALTHEKEKEIQNRTEEEAVASTSATIDAQVAVGKVGGASNIGAVYYFFLFL